MFQSFDAPTNPADGAPRLRALRESLAQQGFAGVLVPRSDAHQGEYVAPRDDRLAWLTGFTGSAGVAIVLPEIAGVFIDGRYRVQVRAQVDTDVYTPVNWPEVKPGDWIRDNLTDGRIAFDPWLHTRGEIEAIEKALTGTSVSLHPHGNLIDPLWPDQPAPPLGRILTQPEELAGESSALKRARIAEDLRKAGQAVAVLTLPDSICWLLNIRGSDIARNPVVHAFALLHADGRVDLFADARKVDDALRQHLGPDVAMHDPADFADALTRLPGPVRVDRGSAPYEVSRLLEGAGAPIIWAADPCALPKARKNPTEIAATAEAHLRDGAAMVEFLTWFDREAPKGKLTEIAVVTALEGFRRATNALREISFDTICGAGEHGAIIHYRVTHGTDRPVRAGELVVVDSGGQYLDGTTDITRTLGVGDVGDDARAAFTRVLQGMIAVSRLRWPVGLAGMHLDALARYPLWLAGQDYDHGTGHGVGAYLCVHEGPQRLSRLSDVPLEPGMILSNEPGYYREGAFGIRIENLIVVEPAADLPGADARQMLSFRTLTYVPIDTRLILPALLSEAEREWLNRYHAEVREALHPRLSAEAAIWLDEATRPI